MPHLTKNIFEDLTDMIKGDVYTDAVRRYLHSTDGSIFRVEPACVVYPKDTEDVVNVLMFAARYGLSVHSRGAGSGLCGSAVGKGIIIDFAKYMNKLVELDEINKTFTCQPGYRSGELDVELQGTNLFFPPDPSSGEYASLGGMFGTNASGAHSVKYGNVSDYIEDAEVVLSDGKVILFSEIADTPYEKLNPRFKRIYDLFTDNKEEIEKAYPDVNYNVAGYNLRELVKDGRIQLGKLFGGSEGTLGVVTKLKFRLLDKPPFDSLVVAYFNDIVSSAKAVQDILPSKPAGIEIMDKSLLKLARESDEKLKEAIPSDVDNVLMIEYDGFNEAETVLFAEEAMKLIREKGYAESVHKAATAEEKAKFWAVRKAAVPILYKLKGRKKILALIEDAAVPTDKLVEYFEGLYEILGNRNADFVIYGHIAKGLLHTRPLLDLMDPHDIDMLKTLADDVFDLVYKLGGAISGEHGDGRLRTAYVYTQYKSIYNLFLEAKALFDTGYILNPEIKTVRDPEQMKKYLRFGSDYGSENSIEKSLLWPEGFELEAEKCHGCSKCTTVTTATRMCPVYKVTRDEKSAPKAKANILRALISGAIDDSSLYEEAFQSVMSKCVACGSCAVECPSNVNIPKLAMEAKSQYVSKFGSSLEDKLLVSGETAGRLTHKFSKYLGPVMRFKSARKVQEMFSGISAEREFVHFDTKPLAKRVKKSPETGRKVIYFSGCYAGYIRPSVGVDTVKVLEAMGFEVLYPEQHCCGLPHLTKGMTDKARKKIDKNLKQWADMLEQAEYVVVSCSSCGLSLTKEWAFLSDSEHVDTIKDKFIHITELVNKNIDKIKFNDCAVKVAYHNPCHLKVQKASGASVQALSRVPGIEVENLNSNCCGMAGSWGMKASNYELSRDIGTPMTAKLNKSDAKYGVTDCPTCTIQMEHMSDKEIKHPVEVIAECID